MGRFGIGGNAYADFFLYRTHPCHPRGGGDLLTDRPKAAIAKRGEII